MAGQSGTVTASLKKLELAEPRVSGSTLAVLGAAIAITVLLVFAVPLNLTDGSGVAMTGLLSFAIVFAMTPPLTRKMIAGGMVGTDVNKSVATEVAELGGIAALFAFSVSLSMVVGLQKLLGNVAEPPFLAAISVFFMASMIGLIDDISNLSKRLKAVAVAFAALPVMLVHLGTPVIAFPFGLWLDFTGQLHLFYWLILVPIGVTGMANAMNMSAGYNGLETGQVAVIAASLLTVGELRSAPDVALLVFGAVLGSSAGLYYFNRFPARIFIGDIGTLGLGGALAAGVILAHIEIFGLIVIAPTFYELFATLYYGRLGLNGQRRKACHNPQISPSGLLRPPPGAERYTLAFWLLSRNPLTEKKLVWSLLAIYACCGLLAIGLAFF